jgi:hypothetical protein
VIALFKTAPLPDALLTRIPGGSAAISPAENDVEFLRKDIKNPGEKQ